MNQNVKCCSYRQNPLLQTTVTCIETNEKKKHNSCGRIQNTVPYFQSKLFIMLCWYVLDAEKIGNRKGCLMLLLLLLLFGK